MGSNDECVVVEGMLARFRQLERVDICAARFPPCFYLCSTALRLIGDLELSHVYIQSMKKNSAVDNEQVDCVDACFSNHLAVFGQKKASTTYLAFETFHMTPGKESKYWAWK
jgi:hypothetical protein